MKHTTARFVKRFKTEASILGGGGGQRGNANTFLCHEMKKIISNSINNVITKLIFVVIL